MIGVEHRCYGDDDGANQHHSVDGLQRTPVGLDPADPDAEQQRYSGTRYFYQNIVPAMRVRVRVRVFVYVCGNVVGMIGTRQHQLEEEEEEEEEEEVVEEKEEEEEMQHQPSL